MTALTIAQQETQHQVLAAIDARPDKNLGPRSKAQYKREVVKALSPVCQCGHKEHQHSKKGCGATGCECSAFAFAEPGVNLLDAEEVANYAAELSTSSRAFLSAAIKTWTKRIRLEAKANATPDNMNVVHATIARLDALDGSIEVSQQKGTKTHIWLTAGEVKRLSASVEGRTAQRDKVVLALLVGAGLRRDEAVNLRWKDVKRQGERVVLDVLGKGAKARPVPVSPTVAGILDAWRRRCNAEPGERVLRGLAAAGQLSDSLTSAQVFNIVRAAGERIGKPELAPHDLRRTFAQLGYENGVPVTQLSRLLGHASVETTQRYLNLELNLDVTASDFVPL